MSEMDAAALVVIIIEKKPVHLDSLLPQQCSGITFLKRQEMRYRCMGQAWYLKYFFDYIELGRPFVFMDELWLNKNMVLSFCWSDGTVDCELNVPSGKGERWIMIVAGSKDGWIQPSIKLWKGKVLSEDYHTDMNGDTG
ncbi:hypothetical protein EMCRGX_G000242 [Ephydatia muelleri]